MADWPNYIELQTRARETSEMLFRFWSLGFLGDEEIAEWEYIHASFEDHVNAVAAMDPEKIAEQYAQLQAVADQLNVAVDDEADPGNDSLEADLANLDKYLTSWRGDAAERMFNQVAHIRVFYNQQQNVVVNALRVLAALMGVAVKVREDHLSLLLATQSAMTKAATPESSSDAGWVLHAIDEGLNAVIDGITKKTLLKKGIDVLIGIAEDLFTSKKDNHVDGDTVSAIVGKYNTGRDLMLARYEHNLREVGALTKTFESELDDRKSTLLAPLPVSTDIDSPDFSYSAFFLPSRPPSEFSDDVERSHHEHLKRHKGGFADPDGPISRALEGK